MVALTVERSAVAADAADAHRPRCRPAPLLAAEGDAAPDVEGAVAAAAAKALKPHAREQRDRPCRSDVAGHHVAR